MGEALDDEPRGVALAAPQIGEPVRLFIVSNAVFAGDDGQENPPAVFINPEIVEASDEKEWMDEGCLSCGNLYGQVERHTNVRVRARNREGKEITMSGTGLLAQIFQHETDHLNGTLFIDKARDVKETPPDE